MSIASNNAVTTKAKADDEVTLSFTYDLAINTPQVVFKSGAASIADTSITYVGTNDDKTWTAKYTVDSADTDGAVTFTLDATATSTLTNGTQITANFQSTDASNVFIDTTIPTFSSTAINTDNDEVTLTFSEDVFANANGTGDLTTSDFTVTIADGVATLTSVDSITKTSDSIYVLNITVGGIATGEETLTVIPASATSIYDGTGNAMSTTQTNNTVQLTDNILPTLLLIDISSNNSIKTKYAGENEIVSMNITASEDINQPYVVFQSGGVAITNAITYTGSGDSWNAQYIVNSSDTNGAISFILDVSDNAGNTNQKSATTNSSSVTKVGNSSSTSTSTTTTTKRDKIGDDIDGELASDWSGYSVASNDNGMIVIIEPMNNDGGGGNSGYKRCISI